MKPINTSGPKSYVFIRIDEDIWELWELDRNSHSNAYGRYKNLKVSKHVNLLSSVLYDPIVRYQWYKSLYHSAKIIQTNRIEEIYKKFLSYFL